MSRGSRQSGSTRTRNQASSIPDAPKWPSGRPLAVGPGSDNGSDHACMNLDRAAVSEARAAGQRASDGEKSPPDSQMLALPAVCWLRRSIVGAMAADAGRAFEESASEPVSGTAKVWVIGRRGCSRERRAAEVPAAMSLL